MIIHVYKYMCDLPEVPSISEAPKFALLGGVEHERIIRAQGHLGKITATKHRLIYPISEDMMRII
jgi:hypothetical protein